MTISFSAQFPVRPQRGGFLRPFGCGWFIREYLAGRSPYGAPGVNPPAGAPQSEIFAQYKLALIREWAMDRAVRQAERVAKARHEQLSPDLVEQLFKRHAASLPYKTTSCRYHSFVTYFSMLKRLGWVEETGRPEPSGFPDGKQRQFYRLTTAGHTASDSAWANPQRA